MILFFYSEFYTVGIYPYSLMISIQTLFLANQRMKNIYVYRKSN